MIALYIVIAIFCFVAYVMKQYTAFLVSYFALLTHLLMLDTSGILFKPEDLCIGINIFLIIGLLGVNKNVFSVKHDILAKFIYVFLVFYFFEWIITSLMGVDSFVYGFKAIRHILIFPVYFILKTIPLKHFKSFLRIGFYITLIQGVLFLLQYFNVHLLYGYSVNLHSGQISYINLPSLIIFFFFFCLKWKYVEKYKYALLLYFFVIISLSGIRGLIIAVLIALLVNIIQEFRIHKRKRYMYILLLVIFLLPISKFAIDLKSDKSGGISTWNDIGNIVQGNINPSEYRSDMGNFSFRMAMLIERWNYLVDNPEYMLLGVGTIHEDSPACYERFKFILGTPDENRHLGYGLIESSDNAWIPITLRFGIIGILLHLTLFGIIIKLTINRNDIWMFITPLYVCLFIKSFDSEFFTLTLEYFVVAYVCLLMRKSRVKQKYVYNKLNLNF